MDISKDIKRITELVGSNNDPQDEINNAVRKILKLKYADALIILGEINDKALKGDATTAEILIIKKVLDIFNS